MPDIILNQGSSLPMDMQTRYAEQADGTHALVIETVGGGGGGGGDVNVHDGVGVPLTSTLIGADQALDVNVAGGAVVGNVNVHDGVGVPLTSTPVGADQALDVNIVAGAGAGGTSMVDDTAFTPGVTAITPAGAMLDDVAPDVVNEGDAGIVRMSANRNLYVRIRDNAGNERGLNINAAGEIAVNDGGNSLTVDDGGVPISVDDNGGSLTVDDGGLSISVDDAGGSLTVDNAALSVVGGGAEATALRVTIANNSTGVLTVDDGGGALTVDGTVTAANTAGDVADDAPDSGNPVKIGGVAVETDGTDPGEVAEGDRAEVRTDLNRRLLVNDAHPNLWSNNGNWAAAQTDLEIQAAPGANLSLYITDIEMSTEGACNITLVRNTAASTDVFGPFYFAANGGLIKRFKTPIRLPADENLGVTSSAAVNHTVSVQGYTAP